MIFTYNTSRINALELALSTERLAKYVKAVGGDKTEALRRYVFNTTVSEALYTPLQGLEIALRNALSACFTATFGSDWYADGKIKAFQYPLTDMLLKAEAQLSREQKPITQGGMISELSFGFWVTTLAPRYDTDLWRPSLRKAFPARPKGMERKSIHKSLNAIRRLRNRVAHHEPILNRNLVEDHKTIIRVLSWISPETAAWVSTHSRAPEILANTP